MCTHGRWIKNQYTRESLFVPCGHCKACQVDRAKKYLGRIYNHEADKNYFRIFVTLTYMNDFLPYIDLSTLDFESNEIPVYRRCSYYNFKNRYSSRSVLKRGVHEIGRISVNLFDEKYYHGSLSGLREPSHFDDLAAVGVLFHDDFKKFLGRFRVYCKRYYNIDLNGKLSYFKVGEYGPTTFRPHFHALLYFPPEYARHYVSLRRAIIKAWPFCALTEWKTNCQIALAGQSYCSTYTVRPSGYPEFLKIRKISQKPTYSRGYGFGRTAFSPLEIYRNVKARNYEYDYQSCDENGAYTSNTAPVPEYVYRRYFPRFKGFCHLTLDEIFSILVSPRNIYNFSNRLEYVVDDFTNFHRQYYRALSYYPFGQINVYDYALTYTDYMVHHALYSERQLLLHMVSPFEFYDNSLDVMLHPYKYTRNLTPDFIKGLKPDPNRYSCRVQDEAVKEQFYEDFSKKAKINDECYNNNPAVITYQRKSNLNNKHYGKYLENAVSQSSARTAWP